MIQVTCRNARQKADHSPVWYLDMQLGADLLLVGVRVYSTPSRIWQVELPVGIKISDGDLLQAIRLLAIEGVRDAIRAQRLTWIANGGLER